MQLALASDQPRFPGRRQMLRCVAGRDMDGCDMTEGNTDEPEALIARIARGDRKAFAEFFAIAAPKVKAYLMRLGSDPVFAEDVAQDVMVTVWRKAGQFDPAKASVMTWLFVIARNRRIDSLRRESSTVTYGQTPPDREDDAPAAHEEVAGWQRDALMRKAIEGLPAEQQEVIRRSFFEDEPHSTISAALGLPLGTVKSRLRIAFAKLRARMEELQ
jgi:RNA polymerase sigma factor (sigma-70 family)